MTDSPVVGFRISQQQQQVYAWTRAEARATGVVVIHGALDRARLRRALTVLVHRHEILRTTFSPVAGTDTAFQVIAEPSDVEVLELDASALKPLARDARVAALLARSSGHSNTGPVFSVARFDESTQALVVELSNLCVDERSFQLFAAELATACAETVDSPDETSPIQYADYSEWQASARETDDDEARVGREHWARLDIAAAHAPTLPFELGTDAPAGSDSVTLPIGQAAIEAVERVARELAVSPEVVLFANWLALMSRLTDRSDLLLHWLWDGRDQAELATALGLFSRPVPIRIDVDATASFADVARRTQDAQRSAVQWHAQCPAEHAGRTSASMLFEFQPETRPIASPSLRFELAGVSDDPYPCKLKLIVTWGRDRAGVTLRFAPGISRDEGTRVARYFVGVLSALTEDPQAQVSAPDLLSAEEVARVREAWNSPPVAYPSDRAFHELFEMQAAQTPDRPALTFRGHQRSYAQLNADANQLAHLLRAHGVSREHVVGLCFERSAEMVVALLAVLKAGGAYVPLSPDHPPARLAQQIDQCRARMVLTTEALADRMPAGVTSICLDRDRALVAELPASNPATVNEPDDLAYVMYTSGSTGAPKGVAVRHRNIVNYAWYMRGRLGLPNDDIQHFAVVSGITADLGKTTILTPLIAGGCVHVIGYEESIDGALFAKYLKEHPVDVLKITPSNLTALMDSAAPPSVLPRRYLILGGESLSWDLVHRVRAAGGCRVINHYGPTETTIGVLTADIDGQSGDARFSATAPVGRPIANAEAFVLDSRWRPAPAGVPGEIVIGGDVVSAGYVNQPAETAARFVAHPFDPSAIVYRTGDRGRWLPDGAIECLGRADGQIKIRGFRVELGEIESTLTSHPAVQQAVVVVRDGGRAEPRLVAYVVMKEPAGPEALQASMRQRLPEYMVPGEIQAIASMPLLGNGKVDRQALAARAAQAAVRAVVPARNETETRLIEIWSRLLNRTDIGIHDNFFELGGHSLVAATVVARIRTAFDVDLPLRAIFESPTVAALGALVDARTPHAGQPADLAAILSQVEEMSDDEVRALLRKTDR